MRLKKKDDCIVMPPNKYGYKIRINHSRIRPLYEAYKERIGEHILSDAQRFHFEALIFRMIAENARKDENYVQSCDSNGKADG